MVIIYECKILKQMQDGDAYAYNMEEAAKKHYCSVVTCEKSTIGFAQRSTLLKHLRIQHPQVFK